MHRITMLDGSTRQSRFLRWGLATAYLFFATSGVMLLASPSVSEIYGDVSYAYSAFIVVGGLLACWGSTSLRWTGEFMGLPLLGSALVAFGLEVLNADSGAPLLEWANFLFLLGTALVMAARWRVSFASYRVAKHEAHVRRAGAAHL